MQKYTGLIKYAQIYTQFIKIAKYKYAKKNTQLIKYAKIYTQLIKISTKITIRTIDTIMQNSHTKLNNNKQKFNISYTGEQYAQFQTRFSVDSTK